MNDFHTQGAIPFGAPAYVQRVFEEQTLKHLLRREWVLLLGPRGHGKTTFLIRLKEALRERGLLVAGVDFQRLSPTSTHTYQHFLQWVADRLARDLGTEGYSPPTGQDADEFASWLERLLPDGDETVVIYMDEAAGVPESMRNPFYGQIRGISTTIAERTETPLRRLCFVFVGMFQPDKLVHTENSPFNTCERVETDDLTIEQVQTLVRNVLVKETLDEEEEILIHQIYEEVGGQPYLLQHVLSLTFEADPIDREEALAKALEELAFSDHMVALMARVIQDEGTQNVAAELSQLGEIGFLPDPDHKHLCVIGLAGRQGATLRFRNKLYARVAQSSPQLRPTETATRSTAPLATLPEARFAFMKDKQYREFTFTAQKGAAEAYNSENYRLALIGYGSALEAVLVDWLTSISSSDLSSAIAKAERTHGKKMWGKDEKVKGPPGWRLVNLIRVATGVGALTGAAKMSHNLREFRNWVHPGSAIATGLAEADLAPEALAASGTFSAIIRDIERSGPP